MHIYSQGVNQTKIEIMKIAINKDIGVRGKGCQHVFTSNILFAGGIIYWDCIADECHFFSEPYSAAFCNTGFEF